MPKNLRKMRSAKNNQDSASDSESDINSCNPATIEEAITKVLSSSSTLKTLATSLAPLIWKELDQNLKALNQKVKSLEVELQTCQTCLSATTSRLNHLEQYSRRNSLRIFGVPEITNENTDAITTNLFKKNLSIDMPVSAIERSHRVGMNKGKPRPIIVKFNSYRDRALIFRNKKKLKGSGISIKEDLTQDNLLLQNEAIKIYGITNVWTSDGVVFFKSNSGVKTKFSGPVNSA